MLNKYITKRFIKALKHIKYGTIVVTLPNKKTKHFRGTNLGANAVITIDDWRVITSMIRYGDIGLAETYRENKWHCEDLTQLFLFGLQNQKALDAYIYGSFFGRFISRVAYFFHRNTRAGSRKNIHAHYDLGNDFYSLWLDKTMTYSSAIFADMSEPLSDAQNRKYDRIIDRLKPSGSLLEIGCGWGGFAERALQKGAYNIKGLTISDEQYAFATKRLDNKAHIALEDYRDQTGTYDQIVSIEMFEAVGEDFWPEYFEAVKKLLTKDGKAIIQTITIDDAYFERYRTSGDAIRTFIFPGGMLPSPQRFREEAEKAGLRVTDVFAFGQDYALTLNYWLKNFDLQIDQIKTLGFDDKFIRIWRFYLTYCMAAFQNKHTDVMQWELQHAA